MGVRRLPSLHLSFAPLVTTYTSPGPFAFVDRVAAERDALLLPACLRQIVFWTQPRVNQIAYLAVSVRVPPPLGPRSSTSTSTSYLYSTFSVFPVRAAKPTTLDTNPRAAGGESQPMYVVLYLLSPHP